jgi:PTH1 family peptidyl-tRNA hydrolase
MTSPIRLIVGLGNPGEEYANTRHNAGVWFVEKIARQHPVTLRDVRKFKGLQGSFVFQDEKIHLFIPTTFMNHSGQAIKLISDFYDIPPESMLIAHDELDIPAGDIRLKFSGGHGGHNGLRDIISHLHTPNFYRLRIGIDHPKIRSEVTDYVLSPPSKSERKLINDNLDNSLSILDDLFQGNNEKAMQLLNTK